MADGWVLKINGDSKGAVRAVDDLGNSTKTLTGRERALVGVLAGVAAATAVAMKAAINYGDWLEKTAQKTGVSTEALSSYKLGAELAGTTQEGLISGLQRLQKNMGAALRSPTSAAATAFKSLGVEFQNADGSLRDVEDLLPDIAAAMEDMEDGTLKTQVAMDLMGRSGAELIPMLNQGADGLKDMRAESEALGVVWTQQDAVAAAEFNDALTRLKTTFAGMVQEATRYWLPTFVDIAEGALLATQAITGLDAAEKRRLTGLEDSRDRIAAQAEEVSAIRAKIEVEKENIKWAEEMGLTTAGFQTNVDRLTESLEHELSVFRRLKEEIGEDAGLITERGRALLREAEAREAAASSAVSASGTIIDELNKQADAVTNLTVQETKSSENSSKIHDRRVFEAEQLANLRTENAEAIRVAREEDLEDATYYFEELERMQAEYQQSIADSSFAILDSLVAFTEIINEAIKASYGENSKEASQAAKVLFAIQQTAALAEAGVNLAVAISAANASAAYPYNIPAIVGATATGVAAIAAIVAQSIAGVADAGLPPGALRAAGLNQHTMLAVRSDEMVLDPVGTAAISRMLEQRGGGGQPVVVNTVLELDGVALGRTVDSHLVRSSERGLGYSDRIRYGTR